MTELKKKLIGALIGLAKSCGNNPKTENTDNIIIEGLQISQTENTEQIEEMIKKVKEEKYRIVPDCSVCKHPCGNTDDYDMNRLMQAAEDVRMLKLAVLEKISQIAARPSVTENEIFSLYRGLANIGYDVQAEELQELLDDIG